MILSGKWSDAAVNVLMGHSFLGLGFMDVSYTIICVGGIYVYG